MQILGILSQVALEIATSQQDLNFVSKKIIFYQIFYVPFDPLRYGISISNSS